jgi:hypothetical protein
MTKYLRHCCHLLMLTTLVSAGELPDDVQRLIDKRGEAIAQIDLKFVNEMEKLKTKYTKAGDLDSANAIVALIKKTPAKVVDAVPADPEFDGTTWAFHNKAGRLGELELLAGGKIKSEKYPNSGWRRIDKDTIRFQYDRDDKSPEPGHVVFRFQGAARDQMSGIQSGLGTPRYLYKLTK